MAKEPYTHIAHTVLDLIGNTPLVQLNKIAKHYNISKTKIYAKLEFLNPSGSVKDRMAKYIIDYAEKAGLLKPNGVIVENSSGNTGTSLAMIAAIKGYQCIITMPDKMSDEKKGLMEAFGAKVVVAPTDVPPDSEQSYYSMARRIAKETPNSYYPDQYNNPKNIEAHYHTTGPEIWEQTGGKIDILVAGVGTGGTLSGAAKFLKEQNKNIKIVAVDPEGSVFFDYFKTRKLIKPHTYQVEGIGEDYLVKALDFNMIDDMVQVTDQQAFLLTRELCKAEGLFAGGSSGGALYGALKIAMQYEEKAPNKALNLVVILPDSGNRYLSKIYNTEWMQNKGYFSNEDESLNFNMAQSLSS